MDVREAIEAGLRILQENEWIKGTSHMQQDGKHGFCASAALEEAIQPGCFTAHHYWKEDEEGYAAYREAYRLLGKKAESYNKPGHETCGLVCFNDDVAETKEDVIKLFQDTLADLGDG